VILTTTKSHGYRLWGAYNEPAYEVNNLELTSATQPTIINSETA